MNKAYIEAEIAEATYDIRDTRLKHCRYCKKTCRYSEDCFDKCKWGRLISRLSDRIETLEEGWTGSGTS